MWPSYRSPSTSLPGPGRARPPQGTSWSRRPPPRASAGEVPTRKPGFRHRDRQMLEHFSIVRAWTSEQLSSLFLHPSSAKVLRQKKVQAEIHGPTEPSRDCAMHSQTGPHHAARQDALEGRKTNEQHAQTPGGHGRRSCPAGAASLVHPAGAKTQSLGVRLVLKFWDESRRKIELERRCRRQPSVVRVIARANQVVGAHRALHPGCCCLACVRNDAPGKLCETGSKLSSLTWEPTFRHKASEYSCPAKPRRKRGKEEEERGEEG